MDARLTGYLNLADSFQIQQREWRCHHPACHGRRTIYRLADVDRGRAYIIYKGQHRGFDGVPPKKKTQRTGRAAKKNGLPPLKP